LNTAVRSSKFALLFSLLAGCGAKRTATEVAETPHTEPFAPVAAASVVAVAVAPVPISEPELSSARIGHLDRPDRLSHLFHALAALDGGRARDDVRILQFGDSHTAADVGTSTLRRLFQHRFGDGGRGFVSIGKPWKTYAQDGVRGGMTTDFEPAKIKFRDSRFSGDGLYGLLGIGIGTGTGGARAWTTIAPPSSRVEVDYLQEPQGGSFDVFIDGARAGRVTTRAAQAASGFTGFDMPDASHEVELRTVGDGDVRVFGMTLDRDQVGVVVDALGINGAQIFTPLRWSEEHFAEQLRHRAPHLVVLAYGTNEALEPNLADAEYERGIVDFLGRVARAVPSASCLLLGPPDMARHAKDKPWNVWPRLAQIVAAQRRVATAAGCAFYDQLEAMGGPGTIIAWANEPEPRANRDHVHLTRTGYTQLGTSLATDAMRAYDEWRAELGLPPTGASRTWDVAAVER
jgi:lysophospholipase L1-like esterase